MSENPLEIAKSERAFQMDEKNDSVPGDHAEEAVVSLPETHSLNGDISCSVMEAQIRVQESISSHVPVDEAADWSEAVTGISDLSCPQTQQDSENEQRLIVPPIRPQDSGFFFPRSTNSHKEEFTSDRSQFRSESQKSSYFIRGELTKAEPEQQTVQATSTSYKTTEIPSPNQIRIPLLYVINNMGGKIRLSDAIGRIGGYFDIPDEELQHTPYSHVCCRLVQEMHASALVLFHEKCLEQSGGRYWKITAQGKELLRKSMATLDREAGMYQATTAASLQSPSSVTEPGLEPKRSQPVDHKNKNQIPSPDQIKMPLLKIIYGLGGKIQLRAAIPKIEAYFDIPQQLQGKPSPAFRNRLVEAMQEAALTLKAENCLERSGLSYWKITTKGIKKLDPKSIQNALAFSTRSKSAKSSRATSSDWKDSVFQRCFGSKSVDSSGEPSTDPHSQLLVPESLPEPAAPLTEDQDNKIQIPSPDQIRIPLLNAICEMGGKIQLGEAISSIAAHFNITQELQGLPLQTVRDRLIEAMRQTAYLLKHEKSLEQLPLGYWKITAKGFTEPGITISIHEDAAASNRSESVKSSRDASTDWKNRIFKKCFGSSTVNSSGEPSTDPHSHSLIPDSLPEPEPPLPEDQDNKIQIPSPDQIRIPLLNVIYEMGGAIEPYEAIERIAEHFGIPAREISGTTFSTVEERLFDAIHDSAKLLRLDNFLARTSPDFWKITSNGIAELVRLNKIQVEPNHPLSAAKNKKTKIPSPARIKIPLLTTICEMGGEIEPFEATKMIARHFKVRLRKVSGSDLSTVEERLLAAIHESARLLLFGQFLEPSSPDFWKITSKGIEELRRLNKIQDKKIEIPSQDQIRTPLLSTICDMGGQIELHQTVRRIAEHFQIPTDAFGCGSRSSYEERLLKAINYSAKRLWFDDLLERLGSGYWKITDKGMDWINRSRKLD